MKEDSEWLLRLYVPTKDRYMRYNVDTVRQCLEEIVSRITARYSPDKIILFGSYAYGEPTADSDLDIMVVMETTEMPHKRSTALRRLLKDIAIPKDIIVKTPDEFERFKNVVGTIVFPAAHGGRVVYARQ